MLLHGESSGFKTSKAFLQRTYAAIDENKDGDLSTRELRRYLTNQGMDAREADQLVKKLDVNGDGVISLDEFTAGFASVVTGQLPDGTQAKKK